MAKKAAAKPTAAIEHIDRQIAPEPHSAMYVWHKYWSRKTWNVVGEHIKNYAQPGEIVSTRLPAAAWRRLKRRATNAAPSCAFKIKPSRHSK
jgi:hypothetical protein